MSRVKSVVILGAGPGGLAAGHHLAENGIRPRILEKQTYVGGLCHTIVRNEFRFDIGGHRWFTKNEELNKWFKTLMRDELVEVDRISRIYFDGKYFSYPVRIKNVLKNAGLFTSAHAVLSYGSAQLRSFGSKESPVNMEEAYSRQFGKKLYEMFFKCYSEKVWGESCTQISADWVEQRTKGLSIMAAIRNSLGTSNSKVASLVEEFLYPRKGYSRIAERMAEDILKAGGEILTKKSVVSIVHDEHGARGVHFLDEGGAQSFMEADAVVSSIPLTILVRNLNPKPPHEVLQAAARLRFRDLITVNLMLDKKRVTGDTWLYIHDKRIPFARLHEPKNWSAEMAPAEKTSLVVEFFCSIGDEIWNRNDEELCDIAIQHLSSTLGFIKKEEVIGAFAFRAPKAYPIYSLDYQANLDLIKSYINTIPNLQIIGRGGTFRYNNSDHSIEMGLMAAKNLLGGNFRIDAVNEAQEYLEEKRV